MESKKRQDSFVKGSLSREGRIIVSEEPRRRRRAFNAEEQSPQLETNVHTEPTVQNTDRLTRRPQRSDYQASPVQRPDVYPAQPAQYGTPPVQKPDVYSTPSVKYAAPPVRKADIYPNPPVQYANPPVQQSDRNVYTVPPVQNAVAPAQQSDVYPMPPVQYSTLPVQRPGKSVDQSVKYTPPRTIVIRSTEPMRNTDSVRNTEPEPVIRNEYSEEKVKSKKKRSILILISAIIGSIYTAYIISYFGGVDYNSASAGEAIGYGIATALVMPHMVMTGLAVLFNWIGYFTRVRGLVLTGAILYCVAAAAFPIYAFFVVPEIVLSFIGFVRMKKYS